MKSFAIAFALLAFLGAHAQNTGGILGVVVDAETKMPLAGASVRVKELDLGTFTDSTGRYYLRDIPAGSYSISASFVGFREESKFNIPVTSGNENEISFELEPVVSQEAEVIVRASRQPEAASILSVQRLTAEEIRSNPGGNFDISRVVNSLPGVAGSSGSVGGFRNDIIIRGGGPGENVFYLDGIEIPLINHFATQGSGGGPTGILNVSFIQDVKLSSSAFDAKYDNALSGIIDFRQKMGNPNHTQGNFRLSGTEIAGTLEGPLGRKNNLTYLASIRRSYLQLLFSAIDLPIRPNYWDFQYKVTYRPNNKSTFTFLGVGAIDEFSLGEVKEATQEKLYTLEQVPVIQQKSYTIGASYRRTLKRGYLFVALSRNLLNNDISKYDSNDESDPSFLRYRTNSIESENKLRADVNVSLGRWKFSYGTVGQYVRYTAENNIRLRAEVNAQPEERFIYEGGIDFFRLGGYAQVRNVFLAERLEVSLGVRTDINTFTDEGVNPGRALSPRMAMRYRLGERWSLQATVGRYARLTPYTILGYRDNSGELVNRSSNYITNIHYVAGIEFRPQLSRRFTLEGFYKKYSNVPVTTRDGISINNQGADFTTVGNEPVTPTGSGEAYGVEFFAQQKLTNRLFGFLSYTFFHSRYTNRDGVLAPSAWDNRHLVSLTLGYKFPRNWELGLKYRYQGGAPYTPFDLAGSRINYLTQGQGQLDYSRFNALRLDPLSVSDIRIDKKWNFRKFSLDVFLDISNWWLAKSVAYPKYSFERDLATGDFLTSDGQPLQPDGSNAIPVILKNDDAVVLPTIGFIIEF